MFEWWNVLGSVIKVQALAQYLTVFFLILSFVATAVSIKATARITALKDDRASELLQENKGTYEAKIAALGQQQAAAAPKAHPAPAPADDEARKKAEEAAQKAAARHLAKDESAKLLSLLSSRPKGLVNVTCMKGDAESQGFLHELTGILTSAGWKVTDLGPTADATAPKGLHFQIKSIQNEPENAKYLIHSFIETGLKPTTELNKSVAESTLLLVVGHKP